MITLAAIVKDEVDTIVQTLESARTALGPGPTFVLDTGSSDGTQDVIRAWGQGRPQPVVIGSRPFVDFAQSRNAALGGAFYLASDCGVHPDKALVCMVDAGVVVRGVLGRDRYVPAGPEKFGPMTATIRLASLEYARPQIFTPGWRYVGKVHEYAEGPGKPVPSGLVFDYCLRDRARPTRWLRDLALLEGDNTPRGMFYYAQTLHDLGRWSQARAAYERRYEISDEGFWQERVVSMIRCIQLARSRADAERYAQAALALDGSRGEAWLGLCRWAEDEQDWPWLKHCADNAIACVPREGALFVDTDREWRANVYAGDAESSRGNFAGARRYWARALKVEGGRMPASERATLELGVRIGDAARP